MTIVVVVACIWFTDHWNGNCPEDSLLWWFDATGLDSNTKAQEIQSTIPTNAWWNCSFIQRFLAVSVCLLISQSINKSINLLEFVHCFSKQGVFICLQFMHKHQRVSRGAHSHIIIKRFYYSSVFIKDIQRRSDFFRTKFMSAIIFRIVRNSTSPVFWTSYNWTTLCASLGDL